MTEEELIEGCKAENRKAQQKLFELTSRRMMGVCVRYSKNREEAEDIFQDVYVKVYKSIEKVEKASALHAWMKRIAVNTAINYYHKHKKHYGHLDVETFYEPNVDYEQIIGGLGTQELMGMVGKLPEGYKMVFNLYVVEGYNHKEIGEMMDISEGTSKSQLYKAKACLRKMIEEKERVRV